MSCRQYSTQPVVLIRGLFQVARRNMAQQPSVQRLCRFPDVPYLVGARVRQRVDEEALTHSTDSTLLGL